MSSTFDFRIYERFSRNSAPTAEWAENNRKKVSKRVSPVRRSRRLDTLIAIAPEFDRIAWRMTKLLNELESLKKYPPIAMGTPDPYHPPNQPR